MKMKRTRYRDEGMNAAIKAAGSLAKLGAPFNLTAQAISLWERVPAERVPAVSKITGLPNHVLRPDLYPPPEQQQASASAAA